MRTKNYSCPNGCKLPPRRKVIRQNEDHTYVFDYNDFQYCPICGSLMPYTQKSIEDFFEIYHIHPMLKKAKRLFLKSEYESAAREAFVVLESTLRSKSGLDLSGRELASKALTYSADKQTGEITKKPLIAINGLKTDSEKNEQEGIMFMLMGFFQGVRNIYQHNQIGSGVSNALTVVIDASFFLHLLDGHSVTKNGRWIRTNIDLKDIYYHMPKKLDRLRMRRILRKHQQSKDKSQNKDND